MQPGSALGISTEVSTHAGKNMDLIKREFL